MSMVSIRSRLEQLEDKQRFLDWFVRERFYGSLTIEELSTYARYGELPDPLPVRPSTFPDALDRKSLINLWEQSERIFGERTAAELECYAKRGVWPEERGTLHHSIQNGQLVFEWRMKPEKEEV